MIAAALGLSIALLSGCKRDIKNNEAIRQGVVTYLAKRQDLLSMDVSVSSVKYAENDATATVHFQAKGNNTPGSGMDMQYVLERKGNLWVVKNRAGDNPHGAGMGMPQGAPGGAPGGGPGSIGAMPDTMPPGHPSTGSGAAPGGKLPPGHPAIPPSKKPEQPQ
jgi:hypothetical protein